MDVACLELTHRLIVEHAEWRIPDMNRELVERATHPECIARLIDEKGKRWADYDGKLRGLEAAQRGASFINALDRRNAYSGMKFPNADETIKTRLGADGILASFSSLEPGPFGSVISRIALPSHWSYGLPGDPIARVLGRRGRNITIEIADRRFRYSRAGLEKSLD